MSTSSSASKIQANLQDLFQANLAPGNAYIRFKLTTDITALLSMKQVQTSVIVDANKITPMPGMPESVIGMMSSRDRVFCVFNLAQLLAVSSQAVSSQKYQIVVLQTDIEPQIYIGLAVTELQGILRVQQEKIQSPKTASFTNLDLFLSGEVQEKRSTIPILSFDRILKALNGN